MQVLHLVMLFQAACSTIASQFCTELQRLSVQLLEPGTINDMLLS